MTSLPRFFARWDHDGSRVCDHQKSTPSRQGLPLHDEPMDRETAEAIANGLNEGSITPEDVAEA